MSSNSKIKDGFTLPIWMQTKQNNDFESFAASPPSPDDAFSFIRYKNADLFEKSNGDANINERNDQTKVTVIKENKQVTNVVKGFNTMDLKDSTKTVSNASDVTNGDGASSLNPITKVVKKLTSQGGLFGFTVASPLEEKHEVPPAQGARRGSKSLPATPAPSPRHSPTTQRRVLANRYFTAPFEPTEDAHNRFWLTAALLSYKKDLGSSTSTLTEEEDTDRQNGMSLSESVENVGSMAQAKQGSPSESKKKKSLRPKPSELREMNFWSPTSM